MKHPLAICTMFQDEPEFLPIWQKYYSRQVGSEHCFLVNHGSEVFSSSILSSVNLFNLPRTPQDERQRVDAIGAMSEYLLNYYETVIYTDIDEIIVPHPSKFGGLLDFCNGNREDVVSCIGLNVQNLLDEDPPINDREGILLQRPWVRFAASMCKPLIVRKRVRWEKGFHSCDSERCTKDVFVFHLRNFDIGVSLRRLERTRKILRRTAIDELGAAHQRVSDEQVYAWMRSASMLPRVELSEMSLECDPVQPLLLETFSCDNNRPNFSVSGRELWKIPSPFLSVF